MTHRLYRHFDEDGTLLYVGISINPLSRLVGHTRSSWFSKIRRIEIEVHPDRATALAAEASAIEQEDPPHNTQRPARRLRNLALKKWLANARVTDDRAGDLIADMRRDVGMPEVFTDIEAMKFYLWQRNACQEAIEAAEIVWRRCEKEHEKH